MVQLMNENQKFFLGDLVIEREPEHPFFWLVKRDNEILDRDQYSNDIRERFNSGEYNKKETL